MPHRDPRCVYLARTLSEADVTVTALTGNGVPARAIDPLSRGGLFGLSVTGEHGVGRIEIWIDNLEQLDEAKSILEELASITASRAERAPAAGPIEMNCEGCGKKLTFQPEAWGTVQECSKCGSFLDVGAVDDGMEWEEGVIEEEDEGEKEGD
ncbi:MAG: hypothetical protein WD768_17230 [Phycisphaeraceae bacterium]